MFEGETANNAKVHALRVALAFHGRLQTLPSAADAAAGGLTVTRHGRRD